MTKEEAIEIVKKDGNKLEQLSEFNDNEEVVLEAIRNNLAAIFFASKELRESNEKIAIEAINADNEQLASILDIIGKNLRNNNVKVKGALFEKINNEVNIQFEKENEKTSKDDIYNTIKKDIVEDFNNIKIKRYKLESGEDDKRIEELDFIENEKWMDELDDFMSLDDEKKKNFLFFAQFGIPNGDAIKEDVKEEAVDSQKIEIVENKKEQNEDMDLDNMTLEELEKLEKENQKTIEDNEKILRQERIKKIKEQQEIIKKQRKAIEEITKKRGKNSYEQ